MSNRIYYLAAPFSHPDPEVRKWRFEATCRAAAELIRAGRSVFSPISHTYGICRYGLPLDWRFWQRHDLKFLDMCDELLVLQLPSWEQSIGVQAEIVAARAMGKPVTFMEPVEETNLTPAAHMANAAEE
jgi:hypothetical protein